MVLSVCPASVTLSVVHLKYATRELDSAPVQGLDTWTPGLVIVAPVGLIRGTAGVSVSNTPWFGLIRGVSLILIPRPHLYRLLSQSPFSIHYSPPSLSLQNVTVVRVLLTVNVTVMGGVRALLTSRVHDVTRAVRGPGVLAPGAARRVGVMSMGSL